MAVTISYIGARGDHLPLGGTDDTVVNINQLDPKYLALGSAVLNQAVPNPFFGNPSAGPLASQPTLTRGQLLRPYPQFLNVQAARSPKASTATTPASSSGASGRPRAGSAAASATPTAC